MLPCPLGRFAHPAAARRMHIRRRAAVRRNSPQAGVGALGFAPCRGRAWQPCRSRAGGAGSSLGPVRSRRALPLRASAIRGSLLRRAIPRLLAAPLPLLAFYRALPRLERTASAVSHSAMLFALAPRHDLTWGGNPYLSEGKPCYAPHNRTGFPISSLYPVNRQPVIMRKRGRGLRVEHSRRGSGARVYSEPSRAQASAESDTARRGSAIGRGTRG